MRAVGVTPSAIAYFRHNYETLVGGGTGLIPESTLEPIPSVPRFEDIAGSTAVEAIGERLVGHATVFVGHSGVGKSTLVNALVPHALRATGHVNEVTGRGRHTSSSAVSLRYDGAAGKGWVIDTPGVRSFGLGHVDPANILRAYTDLADAAEECPRGCTHLPDAPDCAIAEAVAEGRLGDRAAARLDSLQRLLSTFAGTTRT